LPPPILPTNLPTSEDWILLDIVGLRGIQTWPRIKRKAMPSLVFWTIQDSFGLLVRRTPFPPERAVNHLFVKEI
jgi:hypothetical protein